MGKWIEVDGHRSQIVGVMDRPAASFPGQDDTRVLFPYFTMRKMFPNAREHMIIVIAKDGMLAQAQDEVRAVLRLERRVPQRQAGQVRHLDRGTDDRGLPPGDRRRWRW